MHTVQLSPDLLQRFPAVSGTSTAKWSQSDVSFSHGAMRTLDACQRLGKSPSAASNGANLLSPKMTSFTLQKMLIFLTNITIGFDLSESFKQQLGFTVQTLHLQLQRHRVNETTTAGAGSNLFCHVSSVNSQPTSQSCLEKLSCEPLDDYQNVVSQTEVPPDSMHPMLPFPQTNFLHSDGQPP